MDKKILLLIIIFMVLAFVQTSKVNAIQVYVGVQVNHATAPGYNGSTDSNWCLPSSSVGYYSTQMAITKSTSCQYTEPYNENTYYQADTVCNSCGSGYCIPAISPSTNPTYATTPVCVGGFMWSGLLDLADNSNYQAYIYVPNFCPGYFDGSYCWVSGAAGEDCCDTCSNHGLVAFGGESDCASSDSCLTNYYNDTNCSMEATLMGHDCSTCTTGAQYSFFDPRSTGPTSYSCSTTYDPTGQSGIYYVSCSAAIPNNKRVCSCDIDYTPPTGFLFPFTTSF